MAFGRLLADLCYSLVARMARARRSVLIRTLTVLILLRVGFDLGAHGLLASDFCPFPPTSATHCLDGDEGQASSCPAHDHCICHGYSTGAISVTVAEVAGDSASLLNAPADRVPDADRQPQDRPPRT